MMIIQKYFFLLLCLLSFVACQSEKGEDGAKQSAATEQAKKEVYMFTSFREPADEGLRFLYSYDGYQWTALDSTFLEPEVGTGNVMRDPSIVQGPDGIYHLVWTSAWRGDSGFGYASSKDLVNWSEQQFIPVMDHEPTTVNVWAPELYYDEDEDRFIIIWASTIPHRFEKGIEAEDNNHRMYYTTTKDFETFTDTELFLDPGFSVIDAVIVKQDKNQYALILKDNTRPNRNLKMAFSDNPLGPWSEPTEAFTGNFTEGPTEVKIGDEWLIYFDVYEEKTYKAVKTADFKSFTDVSDQVEVPQGHKHGTIFKTTESILEGMKEAAAEKTSAKAAVAETK